MKNLCFYFLIFISLCSHAQQQLPKIKLDLKVLTNTGASLKNTAVSFVEMNTRERVESKTNSDGNLAITLEGGKYWQMQIKEVKNHPDWQIEMHDRPVTGTMSFTVTYDLKRYLRESQPVADRTKLSIKIEKQSHAPSVRPKENLGVVKINLKETNGRPVKGIKVALTDIKNENSFLGITNSNGQVSLLVPIATNYQVDVDGINDFSYVDFPNRRGGIIGVNLRYVPTKIVETIREDTVRQVVPTKPKGTTARELVTLTVKNRVQEEEDVYLSEIGGALTYHNTTDKEGKATFLLPKGKKYMIHFNFQKDVDVFDLTRKKGIGFSNKTKTYLPNPRLQFPETFIPKPEELYITEFKNFIQNQLVHKDTSKAVDLKAKFGGKVNQFSREAVLNLEMTSINRIKTDRVPPLNISFVIDKSGSMAGYHRIESVKEALMDLVGKLRPQDIISIVIFESEMTTVVPAHKINGNTDFILDQIFRIEADGGTNIYNGLEEGYKQVKKNHSDKFTNRVVLLTDGYGVTPVDSMLFLVNKYQKEGIECSTVGVGEDYNVALLKQIGTVGGGLTSLVQNSEDIRAIFIDEVTDKILPVAKNLKITIEFPEPLSYSQLMGFPLKEKRNKSILIEQKFVYRGLSDLAMIRFNLENASKEIESQAIIIKTSYYDVQRKKKIKREETVHLEWSDFTGELELQLEAEKKTLYAIAVMNQSLKVMAESSVTGDYDRAKTSIEETLKSVNKVFPEATDIDVKALRKRLEDYLIILKRI